MRLHINERASKELLEIMTLLNETSTSHTLNKLISKAYNQLVQTHNSEVNINEPSSTIRE